MKKHITTTFCALLLASTIINAKTIAGGLEHSLSICNDLTVRAWGTNAYGQLGNGTNNNSNTQVQVTGLTGITSVKAGAFFSLALKNDGTVWAWGNNNNGQLGIGTTGGSSNVPMQVSGLTGVVAIAAGGYHGLALKSDGSLWAWGMNNNGQLGDGTNISNNAPIQISGLPGIVSIAAGTFHSLVLKSDGTVWTWGSNSNGQLGNGTNINSNVPVQVTGLTGMAAIAGGHNHSLALKNDGTARCWGRNDYGQLGNGSNTESNVPVQVSGLTGITSVAGGGFFSVALKSDGTVWTWGDNGSGQLGNGTTTASNIPVQATGLTGVSTIAGGRTWSIALKSDGTIRTWGRNIEGQLGNGTNTDSNVPVQPTGLCSVLQPCTILAQPGTITGNATPCSGSSQTYSVATVTGATSYTWTLPSGWSGASTTNSINATVGTAGGNITVAAVNACGTGSVQTFTVGSVLAAPSPAITQSGNTLSVTSSFSTYQWYLNGNPISGATGQNHTATVGGNYYVIVTNSSNCSGQSNTIGITVGIGEINSEHPIVIYPNPANNILFVDKVKESCTYNLYNIVGGVIMSGNLSEGKNSISLDRMAAGVYILEVKNKDNIERLRVLKD